MNKLDNIISKIEKFAPPNLAKDWDNSGWQVYLGNNNNINNVMLALSPTLDVIENAADKNCELLITHHPLIFSKINSLSSLNSGNLAIIKAVQANIQVYSAHTNLDITIGGIADKLAEMFELKNILPFCKTNEEADFGRVGVLEQEESLINVINKVKNILNSDKVKLINPSNIQKIRQIALMPGSGGGFIPTLESIDCYITGDVKYHDALEVKNFAVIDAGHFETEKIILSTLKDLIKEFDIEIFIPKEKPPWEFV